MSPNKLPTTIFLIFGSKDELSFQPKFLHLTWTVTNRSTYMVRKSISRKLCGCVLGSSPGGGYLSTVRGTGTCHFLGVLFSNHYGIMGIIFTIFDISRSYGCPFQGIFHNFRNYGLDIYSICGIMALKSTRIYGIMGTNFSGEMVRPRHIIG